NPLELQSLQARMAGRPQVLGPPIMIPRPLVGTRQSTLGCDQQPTRIRIQCLRNEILVYERTIRIGGINEIDSQLDGSPQYVARLIHILRWPPLLVPSKAHRSET